MIKKKYIINVQYATDFQEQVFDTQLKVFMKCMSDGMAGNNPFYKMGHRNNKFKYYEEETKDR